MSNELDKGITGLTADEKRELLAQLLREKAAQSKSEQPLAYGQRALWFIYQLAPTSSAYHIAFTARVRSAVDRAALKRTFQQIVDRHPALRTTFGQKDGELIQVVHGYQEVVLEEVDASGWSEEALYQAVVLAHKEPFDLANGPVIRWQLFTQSAEEHVLLITVHHILFDGYSMFVLLNDLKVIYDAEVGGSAVTLAPPAKYADFVSGQMELLKSEKGQQLRRYWHERLAGELPILNLPADHARPAMQTYNGTSFEFVIYEEETKRLKAFAGAEGVTLYVVLLAAFNALLHRYSGQSDVLVGSPTTNRDVTEYGGTVGYFVDPVVLRSNAEGDPTFRAFLNQTRQTVVDGIAHQGYPFMLLVEELKLPNDPSRSPIFQVMFNMQSLRRIEASSPLFQKDESNPKTLLLERYLMPHEEGQFDLVLDVIEVGGTLLCQLKYNTDLYESTTVERMAGHYQRLLAGGMSQPETTLTRLPLMTEAERQQVLVEWNDTGVAYNLDRCLHQLFEEQVQRTPDAIAVRFGDDALTYDQLNRRANQLAAYLRSRDIGPDVFVGVCMERSLEMVISLYAILKAGGAYVPFDPEYPASRLAYMLNDAQVAILLTQQHLVTVLPEYQVEIVAIDAISDQLSSFDDANPHLVTHAGNLAYMIYTSGSTGNPKGAMNTHMGIVNRLLWMQDAYELNNTDVVLQKTPFSFDVSVWEFFWPLLFGSQLVVARPSGHRDSTYLIDVINRYQVTTLHFVPSMLEIMLQNPDVHTCKSLRRVICSGEAMPLELQKRFFERLTCELHNLYGPTEAAVDVTYWQCQPGSTLHTVPIGRPIANTQIYILDTHMQPVPVGVTGELYIGGIQVGKGYYNRPDLTSERFIADPFTTRSGARLYKTGDLTRYLPDGNIEYLGRVDFQVKIRGLRIELGEIEAALAEHPTIRNVVVIVREDTPGDKRLVGYVVPHAGQTTNLQDLRSHLREKLPDYMIPSAIVTLEAIPLLPNGKVDRRALPKPEVPRAAEVDDGHGAPTTPMEVLLAGIWREILQMERVKIYDNFFDLGGHSLQVMQVATQIEAKAGVKIDPVMMRMQTLGQLAVVCENLAVNPEPKVKVEETALPQKLLATMKRFVIGKQSKE